MYVTYQQFGKDNHTTQPMLAFWWLLFSVFHLWSVKCTAKETSEQGQSKKNNHIFGFQNNLLLKNNFPNKKIK